MEMTAPHCIEGAECFACKCAVWRKRGAPPVTYVGGQDSFHNAQGTLRDRERQAIADARRGGYEPERYQS